ncbi:MAG: PBP1A family penicillin-binding protein [Elusimicrobiota bacterium]|jgi:penicillin-binding protein 1A|nr:PBP1A family penicillin-binding protein [Elusimicrobiota bacterium]
MFKYQRKDASKSRWGFWIFIFLSVFIPLFIIASGAVISYLVSDLPSLSQLENYTPNLSAKIYDKNNNLISEFYTERRAFVSIDKTPKDLKNAFIAIEDNDFYEHWGVSTRGIMRAFSRIITRIRISEGGSTISQQLARSMFLNFDKTLTRKLKELILTIQIESIYSKDEIMQFYLNQIYFGSGAYGAQAASQTYFNKDVENLTLGECAALAAIPKSPNVYNPFRNMQASISRRNTVLARMRELGYITKEQEENAAKEKLFTKEEIEPLSKGRAKGHYFVEYLRIMLASRYGSEAVYTSGLSIYTTLDMQAQNAAEYALEMHLNAFDEKREKYFKDRKIEPVKVQGALLAIDPKTGAIRAMVGGRDFKETQFNRATQAKRQAGSSFKPFVYLAAIEEGYTAASLLEDEPMVFKYNLQIHKWELVSRDVTELENIAETVSEEDLIDTNKVWNPLNYNRRYRGFVTLRTALALSINTCAVEMIMRVTPRKVVQTARRLGITSPLLDTLSLALGSSDVTLQEMVSAYSVFAAKGVKTTPYVITKIEDRNGKLLEQHIPQQQEVISPQASFIMTNMLRSVIERGSGWAARELHRPSAGKTGTTNDFSDAWFIGYTPELVAGVWVGYDDRSIDLGEDATGGVVAAPIWTDFMKNALAGLPISDFSVPQDIEWALIDPQTGLLSLSRTPGVYLEAFIKGTAPRQYFRGSQENRNINSDDLSIERAGF